MDLIIRMNVSLLIIRVFRVTISGTLFVGDIARSLTEVRLRGLLLDFGWSLNDAG